jgi:hypothetical protein
MVKRNDSPPIESRAFTSPDEIDSGVAKLRRRIKELEQLDIRAAVLHDTGAVKVARSNVQATIRDVFGRRSPEFDEHAFIDIWAGSAMMGMDRDASIQARERGRTQVIGILNGLIGRLEEKRVDLLAGASPAPSTYFDRLNLHPRILDVAHDLFMDGHHWEAVFAASKALVNYVKERSGRDDLEGASLVRTVFSRNSPGVCKRRKMSMPA